MYRNYCGIKVLGNAPTDKFRVGPFVYAVEDKTVLVTKDTPSGIITINQYSYRNNEIAGEAAWRMALRQAQR